MKKLLSRTALILMTVPFLTQCVAADKDVRSIDLRTRSLNMRLGEMEKNVGSLQNQGSAQADIADSLDRINNRLLQLEGRLDETTHGSRTVEEKNKLLKDDLQSRVNTLSDQVMVLSRKIDALEAQYNAVLGNVAAIESNSQLNVAAITEIRQSSARDAADRALAASRAAEEARMRAQQQHYSEEKPEIMPVQTKKKPDELDDAPVVSAPAPVVSKPAPQKEVAAAAAPTASGPEKAQYDAAYEQFKAKQYKQAYNSFSDFLKKHPQSSMAANARFWLGDSLYNQNEYELAILEYQKVIADYPSSPKAPAALLKQGLSFEKLNEKATAGIVYNKLLNEYPSSEQATTARQRLDSLK